MNNLLQAAVEAFLAATAGEVSKSTLVWYGRLLSSFVAFVGPEVSVESISPGHIRAYRAHLVARELSAFSIHGHQRAVRRLFSWLLVERLVGRNVALDVPLVRLPAQVPKAITDDDVDRLLARLPQEDVRDRAIILLLVDTGCRVGGLCSLTLDALDLPGRCATVIEKGNRGRRIYFTEMTADALALYRSVRPAAGTEALFLSASGTPLTTNGVRLMLERVGKRAGVKGRVNAHAFRHHFARSFLRNGGNLAALGRILGHSPGSPITAKYYAVFDDDDLRRYHEQFSPLAQGSG